MPPGTRAVSEHTGTADNYTYCSKKKTSRGWGGGGKGWLSPPGLE